MIYRSFEELHKLVSESLRDEKYSESLNHIQTFVFNIIQNNYLNGILLDVRGLDELCLQAGKEILSKTNIETQNNSAEKNNLVIYIATELYHTGGHTAVIEDFITALPDNQHAIILTDAFNTANKEQIEKRFAKSPAKLFFAPFENLHMKLIWLVEQWQKLNPERVYLFNHHHDSIAVAAAQPKMPGKLYFYHHADIQLALGTHLNHATHIDTTLIGYQHCRTRLNIENNLYVPLVANDLGVRSQNDFLQSGKLRTSSSGSFHKFASPYLYAYEDIVVEILKTTGGSHVHFGFLSVEYLKVIRTKLAANHIAKGKFIYIEHVPSLWRAMHEYQVDVYLSSFAVGGGKACIEIMGSGTPFIGHRNYRSSLLNEYSLIYPEAFCWETPNDLINFLRGITLQKIQEHSIFARTYYEKNFMPTVFKENLSSKNPEEINLITNDRLYDNCNKQQLFMDINNKMLEMTYKILGGFSKLYVNIGNNYSEQEIVFQRVNSALSNFSLSFDLSDYSNIQSLRWDPMEDNWCKVTIEKMYYLDRAGNKHNLDMHLLTSNGIQNSNGTIVFETFDPNIFIPVQGDVQYLSITGKWEIIGFGKIEQSIKEKNELIEQSIKEKNELKAELKNIYDSRGWKALLLCRKIKNKIITPSTTAQDKDAKFTRKMLLRLSHIFKKRTQNVYYNCDRPPSDGLDIYGDLVVNGWAIAPKGISKIEVYCDDAFLGDAFYGILRPDVRSIYPSIADSEKSGFRFPISNLATGSHTLTLKMITVNGKTETVTRKINVKRSDSDDRLIGKYTKIKISKTKAFIKKKTVRETVFTKTDSIRTVQTLKDLKSELLNSIKAASA